MEVPFPRAASRRLISFLTFHISMFASCSAFALSWSDMVGYVVVETGRRGVVDVNVELEVP